MRSKDVLRFFLLPALVLLFMAGVSSAADNDSNVQHKIRNIRFIGVESVNKNELAESLAVKVPSFWQFWAPHPVVHIKELEDDTLRIKQYYQSYGYYQAAAEYSFATVHPEKIPIEHADYAGLPDDFSAQADNQIPEYDVVFAVREGPPVIVRNLDIDCLCELETITVDEIKKDIELKSGRIFKTEDYDHSKARIRKLLGNRAYPYAKVSGSAVVDLNDNSADVTFNIDPGTLYYFGDIRITGHENYVREKVIRRAITFKSGEKFAAAELDQSRRNLFDLNIFKTAVITMGEPAADVNTVPVDIQVKPRKKQSVKLGAGYGTDDGLRLQAAWSYRNLTSRADRLTLRARRSDILENIYAEYLLPYFLSAQNNLVSTSGYDREEKDYYTLQRLSAEVNFYRKLGENWYSGMGYNLEANRPEDIRVEDSEGIIDPRDTENYLVSSVKFHVEHNTIDDILNSREGSSVSLSIENASDYLGSEISYIRPGIEARKFIPIFWDMVLAGRVDFRTIRKSGNTDYIPISKQFFLGGSKSVRGYGFERLGVIDENDVIRDVSGLSSFTGNLELRFPVYKDFSGVIFLDTGMLDPEANRINFRSLRYTTGLGLRYNTIIGPIQLDYGYQLNPAKSTAYDDPQLNRLLDKDRWYVHFNIGQTF